MDSNHCNSSNDTHLFNLCKLVKRSTLCEYVQYFSDFCKSLQHKKNNETATKFIDRINHCMKILLTPCNVRSGKTLSAPFTFIGVLIYYGCNDITSIKQLSHAQLVKILNGFPQMSLVEKITNMAIYNKNIPIIIWNHCKNVKRIHTVLDNYVCNDIIYEVIAHYIVYS